jgi:methanogen homocitrate synthase
VILINKNEINNEIDTMYSKNKLIDCLNLNPIDIEICDVTLRDGEQTPGVAFSMNEKIDIAIELDSIGVEIIEAGFPVVSAEEKQIVKKIANIGLDANICCLSRSINTDVDAAIDCEVDIVSIFVALSDLHLKYKYHKKKEEMLDCAMDTIDYAKEHGLKVRFAIEDASRTKLEDIKHAFLLAEERRVEYVSIADTIGILNPSTTHYLISEIKKIVKTPICIHCHDDLGMATANTLAAAEAGAKQLHTTINGIGERAGNAALEEVIIALCIQYGLNRYDATSLTNLSHMVKEYSKINTSVNKSIVGKNVFSHESGIHVMAVLENHRTYELFDPELVGGKRNLIIGKHTGTRALKGIIESRGISITETELLKLIDKIKNYGDIKEGLSNTVIDGMISNILES